MTKKWTVKAVYSMGLTGIEIVDIQHGIEDKIKWRYVTDSTVYKVNTSKIREDEEIGSYFQAYMWKVPLNECLKV